MLHSSTYYLHLSGALFGTLALVASTKAFPNGLSTEEQQKVLNAVDRTCGDTFCGGDLNYIPTDISCTFEEQACRLDFLLQAYGNDDVEYEQKSAQCLLTGFSSIGDLIADSRRGADRLKDGFYNTILDCINEEIYPVHKLVAVPEPQQCADEIANYASNHYGVFKETIYFDVLKLDDYPSRLTNPDYASGVVNYFIENNPELNCAIQTVYVYRSDVECLIDSDNGTVCSLPTPQGAWYVSDDYVDTTHVTYVYNNDRARAAPPIRSRNDDAALFNVPDADACYDGLLMGDGNVFSADSGDYSHYRDARFLVRRAMGITVKNRVRNVLDGNAESNYDADSGQCRYKNLRHITSTGYRIKNPVTADDLHCQKFNNNGSLLCSYNGYEVGPDSHTDDTIERRSGAGYFNVILHSAEQSVVFYNRFD